MRKRLRHEDGASAVEFALICPLLILLIFGIIGFGIAFLQIQTMRGAVREGARYAATGGSVSDVQKHTVDSSTGSIANAQDVLVNPHPQTGPVCTSQNIGDDSTVSYDLHNIQNADGRVGVEVQLIFFTLHLTPTVTANFRCEV